MLDNLLNTKVKTTGSLQIFVLLIAIQKDGIYKILKQALIHPVKPRIPPAVVFLIHIALVWATNRYLDFGSFAFPYSKNLALLIGLLGGAVAFVSVYIMRRAGTTVDPVFPERASRLVTTNVFGISRNPIYLALLLMLLALSLWAGNVLAFLWCATFTWHLTCFQIKSEEKALLEKFGEEYLAYKKRVRRWI